MEQLISTIYQVLQVSKVEIHKGNKGMLNKGAYKLGEAK